MKIEFCWMQVFEILIIHKPSMGNVRYHTKFGPNRFNHIDVYWIQKNKQTNRQTDKQSKYIDGEKTIFEIKKKRKVY